MGRQTKIHHDNLLQFLIVAVDLAVAHLAFIMAYMLRFAGSLPSYFMDVYAIAFIPVTFSVFFVSAWYGTSHIGRMRDDLHELALSALTVAAVTVFLTAMFCLVTAFYTKPGLQVSRMVMILFFFLHALMAFAWRCFARAVIAHGSDGVLRRILVIGSADRLDALDRIRTLMRQKSYRVLGVLDSRGEVKDNTLGGLDVLGTLDDMDHVIDSLAPTDIIIALGTRDEKAIVDFLYGSDHGSVRFFVFPDLAEIMIGRARMAQIGSLPLIETDCEPINIIRRTVKRLMDVVVSLLGLIVLSPLLIVIAIAVFLDSPGPVIYRQKRLGKNAREFETYKFRSMVAGAEDVTGPVWASHDDRRVTRTGRWLRRMSLDELPQLINILVGHMSLAGPRPERRHFADQYSDFTGLRLSVRPGMTGLAQVNGRDDLDVREKIRYDLFYIRNYTVFLDFVIIARTVLVVFRGHGVN